MTNSELEELIWRYANTRNEQEENELLLLLVYYFVSLYNNHKKEFIDNNDLDEEEISNYYEGDLIEFGYDKTIEDYSIYIADLLYSLRQRAIIKQNDYYEKGLNYQQVIALDEYKTYIYNLFAVIHQTETNNVLQMAELKVANIVQVINPNIIFYKRWVARLDACPICQTLARNPPIPIDQPFLYNGEVVELENGDEFIYKYIDRFVAIAHPNDRCRIEILRIN